jgi:hypothetical protein
MHGNLNSNSNSNYSIPPPWLLPANSYVMCFIKQVDPFGLISLWEASIQKNTFPTYDLGSGSQVDLCIIHVNQFGKVASNYTRAALPEERLEHLESIAATQQQQQARANNKRLSSPGVFLMDLDIIHSQPSLKTLTRTQSSSTGAQ